MSTVRRLLVLVEGQTEEDFVNEILAPHLWDRGYANVSARLLGNARQRSRRGGIQEWFSVRKDILNHLKQDLGIIVTTMVDYYGLPQTWPGRTQSPQQAFEERAATVEREVLKDVSDELGIGFDRRRFVPYVVMHEFEGLLFSDPEGFGRGIARRDLSPKFQAIRDRFATPEEINDSPVTAPSKRVEALFPGYQKPLMGVLAAQRIGLDSIRRECRLFSGWIDELEQRAV
jgi:hypothetical protein